MHTKDLASRCMSQPLDMKKNLMEYVHLGTFIYSKTTPNTFCTCIYFTQCMESLNTDLLVMEPAFSSFFFCQPLSPHRNDDTKHIQPLSDASSFSSLTYPCLLRDHNKLATTTALHVQRKLSQGAAKAQHHHYRPPSCVHPHSIRYQLRSSS